jgi:hypothetical protein
MFGMALLPFMVGYFSIQWNRAAYLGKSPEQVVAMGRAKWSEAYGASAGNGSQQLAEADTKYGDALLNLNDRAMSQVTSKKKTWLGNMRGLVKEYGRLSHRIGEEITGGGSMWRSFDATIHPDVEEAITKCITAKKPTAIPSKSFYTAMNELDSAIYTCVSDATTSPESREAIRNSRAELGKKHNAIMTAFASGTESDVWHFKIYMHRKLEIAGATNFGN